MSPSQYCRLCPNVDCSKSLLVLHSDSSRSPVSLPLHRSTAARQLQRAENTGKVNGGNSAHGVKTGQRQFFSDSAAADTSVGKRRRMRWWGTSPSGGSEVSAAAELSQSGVAPVSRVPPFTIAMVNYCTSTTYRCR